MKKRGSYTEVYRERNRENQRIQVALKSEQERVQERVGVRENERERHRERGLTLRCCSFPGREECRPTCWKRDGVNLCLSTAFCWLQSFCTAQQDTAGVKAGSKHFMVSFHPSIVSPIHPFIVLSIHPFIVSSIHSLFRPSIPFQNWMGIRCANLEAIRTP